MYTGDFTPNVRPVSALRAWCSPRQGHLDQALDWAAEHHVTVDDELSYVHEFEHVVLAWMLLAQYRAQRLEPTVRDASRLLERLLVAAEKGERTGSVIEILVLQAFAHHARGD